MMVMIAESKVNPIMTHTPTFVEVRIWSFQNAEMGTMASTISVNVVNELTKYWKPSKMSGVQQEPGIRASHKISGGSH